ncbi:MAG: hypothetical protein WC567_09695, partial [Kiritimatiellia bacterium]
MDCAFSAASRDCPVFAGKAGRSLMATDAEIGLPSGFELHNHVLRRLDKKTFAGVPINGAKHLRHRLPFGVVKISEAFQEVVAIGAAGAVFFYGE